MLFPFEKLIKDAWKCSKSINAHQKQLKEDLKVLKEKWYFVSLWAQTVRIFWLSCQILGCPRLREAANLTFENSKIVIIVPAKADFPYMCFQSGSSWIGFASYKAIFQFVWWSDFEIDFQIKNHQSNKGYNAIYSQIIPPRAKDNICSVFVKSGCVIVIIVVFQLEFEIFGNVERAYKENSLITFLQTNSYQKHYFHRLDMQI